MTASKDRTMDNRPLIRVPRDEILLKRRIGSMFCQRFLAFDLETTCLIRREIYKTTNLLPGWLKKSRIEIRAEDRVGVEETEFSPSNLLASIAIVNQPLKRRITFAGYPLTYFEEERLLPNGGGGRIGVLLGRPNETVRVAAFFCRALDRLASRP